MGVWLAQEMRASFLLMLVRAFENGGCAFQKFAQWLSMRCMPHSHIGIADGMPSTRARRCRYSFWPASTRAFNGCHGQQCLYTHVYTYVYTHVYAHVHTHVYTHVHTHVYTHVYTHAYTHAYTHVYTHVYTRDRAASRPQFACAQL